MSTGCSSPAGAPCSCCALPKQLVHPLGAPDRQAHLHTMRFESTAKLLAKLLAHPLGAPDPKAHLHTMRSASNMKILAKRMPKSAESHHAAILKCLPAASATSRAHTDMLLLCWMGLCWLFVGLQRQYIVQFLQPPPHECEGWHMISFATDGTGRIVSGKVVLSNSVANTVQECLVF